MIKLPCLEVVLRGHHIYKSVWLPAMGETTLPVGCPTWTSHLQVSLVASNGRNYPACRLSYVDITSTYKSVWLPAMGETTLPVGCPTWTSHLQISLVASNGRNCPACRLSYVDITSTSQSGRQQWEKLPCL